jgi:hypothetical protein
MIIHPGLLCEAHELFFVEELGFMQDRIFASGRVRDADRKHI